MLLGSAARQEGYYESKSQGRKLTGFVFYSLSFLLQNSVAES